MLEDISTMRRHIVSDNYNVFLMNRYNYNRFDFLKLCEIRQVVQLANPEYKERLDMESKNLPDFFSRYYLEVLIRKKPFVNFPSDWSAMSVDESMPNVSDLVIEGKKVAPTNFQMVVLPPRLDKGNNYIELMFQVIRPGSGDGTLYCETCGGTRVFETSLRQAMERVSKWRRRMTFRIKPLSRSDFPLKISASRGSFTLSYVFLRTAAGPPARRGTFTT